MNMRINIKKKLQEKLKQSISFQERAKQSLVSFYTTGPFGVPQYIPYIKKGKGARLTDIDDNEYIDFCMAIGPLILGHAHESVVQAAAEVLQAGIVHAQGNAHEVRLAELLCETVPGIEAAAFCNSGTEATMHALKIARALTGKSKIAKFEGTYHGVHEIAQISSRSITMGPPEKPVSATVYAGIPEEFKALTLTLSYNYDQSIEMIRAQANQLAAVIVEPVPTVCPIDFSGFLRQLRAVTRENNIVLIFDEVLSGFRMGLGGASAAFDITADLITFGKIIGGGFPVGAIGGSRAMLAPLISDGSAYVDVKKKAPITGTFSGNPITMAAGAAVIEHLKNNPQIYTRLEELARKIKTELEAFAGRHNFPLKFLGVSSWLQPNFSNKPVKYVRDVDFKSNAAQFELLRRYMLTEGIILGDVPLIFMSSEHTDADIERFIELCKNWIVSSL